MPYGAGWVAAQRYGAAAIVDPRPYAVGSIRDTYAAYPGTGPVLPAMGYGEEQVQELAETIRKLGEPSLTDVVERFLETSVPAAVASRQRAEAPVG
jgi:predicted GTPase